MHKRKSWARLHGKPTAESGMEPSSLLWPWRLHFLSNAAFIFVSFHRSAPKINREQWDMFQWFPIPVSLNVRRKDISVERNESIVSCTDAHDTSRLSPCPVEELSNNLSWAALHWAFFSASANCTLVKWQNVNHLVGKWAPAAIVREWRCRRKGKWLNEVSCQKSTVQRVIWENMTTLQRQGVIMASQ